MGKGKGRTKVKDGILNGGKRERVSEREREREKERVCERERE